MARVSYSFQDELYDDKIRGQLKSGRLFKGKITGFIRWEDIVAGGFYQEMLKYLDKNSSHFLYERWED